MNDYEQLQHVVHILTGFEIVFFSLAGVCLIIVIVLFFKFNITDIIALLSGTKKQKQLAAMKAEKELSNQSVNNMQSEGIQNEKNNQTHHNRNGDTISKSSANLKQRHETILNNKQRITVVQNKRDTFENNVKKHSTVVMERKDKKQNKYKTLEEKIFVNSDDIIE